MCFICAPRHASRSFVCHEASERRRASVAMRRSASISEMGAMSHRKLAIHLTCKCCRRISPAGQRSSVLWCRAQPAKAAGNGNGGSRRLQGAH